VQDVRQEKAGAAGAAVSLATLRTRRVDVFGYTTTTNEQTGVASSTYQRRLSPDRDGKWWASLGTIFGRERAPTTNPQDEQLSMWSFGGECPITPDDVIRDGTAVYRVQSVMPRRLFRDQVQAYCVRVDDADAAFLFIADPVTP
jgi:hypothetical protein